MDKATKVMMNLIGSEVCGKEFNSELYISLTEEEKVGLYRLSKKHDLAHIVGNALINRDLLNEDNLKSAYQNEVFTAVYRYESIDYELKELRHIFNEAKIPFIPLKGSVIRKYYPEPWMRTSCDIDILVHEKDLKKSVAVLEEKLGFTCDGKEKGSHDMQMYAPSGVHLELHYTLIEEGRLTKADKILSNIWNYVEDERDGLFQKGFSSEAFYFYHIAHMTKHFLSGGCGIKPFVDLWILNHSEKFKCDKEKRDELLLKGGLLKFANEAKALSEVWFEEMEHTEITKQMERYVLQGWVYGTIQNRVVVQQVKSGSKFKYIISRIWLPYDTLKFIYPVLEQHKWLFPLFQIRRWFRLFFKGRFNRSVNELSICGSVTKEQRKEISSFLSELDLQ